MATITQYTAVMSQAFSAANDFDQRSFVMSANSLVGAPSNQGVGCITISTQFQMSSSVLNINKDLVLGATATAGTLTLFSPTGTKKSILQSLTTTDDLTFIFPATAGTTGQMLTANTTANTCTLTWANSGGTGTVTTVSVVSANGFTGTVANATSTPAITLTCSATGILKSNGTAISAATSHTDYLPGWFATLASYANIPTIWSDESPAVSSGAGTMAYDNLYLYLYLGSGATEKWRRTPLAKW